jgi:hypothetical protein
MTRCPDRPENPGDYQDQGTETARRKETEEGPGLAGPGEMDHPEQAGDPESESEHGGSARGSDARGVRQG